MSADFGDMWRLWMASENITMGDMAKNLGVSKSTVSRICAGESPDTQTLLKIIQWLFGDDTKR